ncbi:MAG: lipopolysaccharide heptosyltransferase II [Chlamydiia bacterium]|nr:lipopolysaccharide heptosyltransferase II [Chlamydiia bacterium]
MSMDFQNIIVRMPNWLGDSVMATPILADVRTCWPKATITAMCQGSTLSSLLKGNPHLNEIFSFSRPNGFLRREQHRDLIARIRQGHYDLGLLLTNSFSSAWWFWRGEVSRRVGFATDFRRVLLTDPLPIPEEEGKEHLVTTYKRLLLPLGIPLSSTSPALYLTLEEKEAAQQVLRQYGIHEGTTVIGINPGAAYGSAKCWPPEYFRALIQKLAKRPDTTILCFADQSGAPLVHRICEDMPTNVINLAGLTTLRELMALIAQCSLFLTNDSGPMHIAAAFKIPLVALFGSTNERATGPYNHGHVIHKHVSCSPCYKRTCPIDFRCMRQIEVEEVYQALIDQLIFVYHQNEKC